MRRASPASLAVGRTEPTVVLHTPRFGFRQRVEHRSRLRPIPSLASATIGMTAAALGPVAAGARDAADTWRDAVDRERDRDDQHRRDDDLSARDHHDGPRRAEREAQRDGRDRGDDRRDDANANRRDDAHDDSPRRGERQDAADQSTDDADTGDVGPRGLAERLRDSVENAAIRRQENAEAFADRQRGRHGDDTASDDDGDSDTVAIDLGVDATGTPVLDVAIELPELARRAGVELDLPELSGPIPLDGAADDDSDTNDPAASDAAAGGDPAFGYVS